MVKEVDEMGSRREMSERQIEKRDRERDSDRVMNERERETKWSLKLHFLVVESSLNREDERQIVSKVNTME